jgi:hypothetical protein
VEEASERFGLGLAEYSKWERVCRYLSDIGKQLKRHLPTSTRPNEWMGVFASPRSTQPSVVFQGSESRGLIISNQPQVVRFNRRSHYFAILENSCTLSPYVANDQIDENQYHQSFFGFVARMRVQNTIKEPKKRNILLYYGRIRDLVWNPAQFKWPKVLGLQ